MPPVPFEICLPTPFALLCGGELRLFLRGILLGILSLAGLFNLLLLMANWRNRSHLVFAAISLAAALATLAPQLMPFWLLRVLVPALLCLFIYVLFPVLRNATSPPPLFRLGRQLALWLVVPGVIALSAAALGTRIFDLDRSPMNALLEIWPAVQLFWVATAGTGAAMLAAALQRQQQGAILLSAGMLAAFGATGLEVFALPPGFFEAPGTAERLPAIPGVQLVSLQGVPSGVTLIRPAIGGLLIFVLSMVFLMGPNRYRMHRQLDRSRGVLHEANQKLRHLDALKNRYLSSSAREMQVPLEAMLADCIELVEDPAYRLSARQLAALSGVMDMARRMIRRNERAARLFESSSDRSQQDRIELRDLDGAEFLNMLAIVLGERWPALQLHFVDLRSGDSGDLPEQDLRVAPALIEAAFEELVENSARHGGAGVQARIALASHPEAGFSLQYREAVPPANQAAAPAELQALVDEFESRPRPGQTAGMGLGLSLVRRIAEMHGGRLEIRSESFAGAGVSTNAAASQETVFAFTVPEAGQSPRAPELDWSLRHVGALLASGDPDRQRQARAEADRLRVRFATEDTAQELERVFAEAGVPELLD